MHIIDKQVIIDYVATEFGIADSDTLQKIHQGGLNNTKGRDYENYFQLYKVFAIAAQDNCDYDKQLVATQVVGFVDDICHIDGEQHIKYNYQAKNSLSSAADWTDEISKRFRKQRAIDDHCFKISQTKNYLLVSSEAKAIANLAKIPSDLKDLDTCQYFEYHQTLFDLVYNTSLFGHIQKLINNDNNSDIDYAAKLILGVLQANQYKTVTEVFSQAQSEAHPNPFIKFRTYSSTSDIPSWLQQILTNPSYHLAYRLEYNKLTVSINSSFMITVDIDSINNIPAVQANNIITIRDLAKLLMLIAAQDLGTNPNLDTNKEV